MIRRNVFLLASYPGSPRREVIHSSDSELRINVHCLDCDPYYPDSGEIQLYGKAGDKTYAFETIGIASNDATNIVGAVQWYAEYIHYPEMDIVAEDPRTESEIAK